MSDRAELILDRVAEAKVAIEKGHARVDSIADRTTHIEAALPHMRTDIASGRKDIDALKKSKGKTDVAMGRLLLIAGIQGVIGVAVIGAIVKLLFGGG